MNWGVEPSQPPDNSISECRAPASSQALCVVRGVVHGGSPKEVHVQFNQSINQSIFVYSHIRLPRMPLVRDISHTCRRFYNMWPITPYCKLFNFYLTYVSIYFSIRLWVKSVISEYLFRGREIMSSTRAYFNV